jgi:hypothetical protein
LLFLLKQKVFFFTKGMSIPNQANPTCPILQGTLDQYIRDISQWTARYFTLLSDGTLEFFESKLEKSNRLGNLLINCDVYISKSESTEGGHTRQTIHIDATLSSQRIRNVTTVLIGTHYKSVQEAWFQMLLRFSGTPKTEERPSYIQVFSDDVQFEGPLEKRGYWNPAWKSRYFVLSRQGSLSYFAAESDKRSSEPLGSFPVSNAIVACIPSAPGRPQFTILVQSPGSHAHGRTFTLAAPNDTALTRWVRELSRAARPDATPLAPPVAAAAAGDGGGGADAGAVHKDR